jgi:hypothetical protein
MYNITTEQKYQYYFRGLSKKMAIIPVNSLLFPLIDNQKQIFIFKLIT